MSDKAALRKEAMARRKAAFAEVDIAPATARLDGLLADADGPVAFYWPMRTEIDTRPAMERAAARGPVCLPVTQNNAPLVFRAWRPGLVLERDGFGTEVPGTGPDVTPRTLVVPMLAFDRRGHRLGYGAGHYDRTLEALRQVGSARAIGFAYAAQEVERLPDEPWDIPLDMIVTERETIYPG